MLGARSAWIGCVGACALSAGMLSACQAFDPSKLDILLSPVDTPPYDAGRDTGADEPCDMLKAELCNGLDDDCDDKIDEKADEACYQPQSASVCSDDGRCVVVSCDPGYVDCNQRDNDGCEHSADSGPCPDDECEEMCLDAGHDSGPIDEPEDAAVEDAAIEDAAIDEPDACIEMPEVCDGMDNDCDDEVDETAQCAIERCIDTTPSYRGETCDRCVCEKCGAQRADCQEHPNATWREQCRDVLECYVIEDRAGNCGANADCYASGACTAPINIAAGGADGDDASGAIAGNCTPVDPLTHACMGATNYRNQCTQDLCAAECAE
jgi:hypothetical protein